MNRLRSLPLANLTALALFLALFSVSLFRVLTIGARNRAAEEQGVVIRFAHWNLEDGVREVYNEIAAEYMALHPGVRVEQLAIPGRVFPAWLRTQLIGGTAPDLITLGGVGITDELVARYFAAITTEVEQPNPYNASTPLAGVPWRDTFIDGLTSQIIFNDRLQEVYTIGLGVPTFRAYYNLDLYKEIVGHERLPESFAELIAFCERTAAWSQQKGLPTIPIGASAQHSPALLLSLSSVTTQKYVAGHTGRSTFTLGDEDLLLDVLRGDITWRSPPLSDALRVVHAAGRWFPPGFQQIQREDMAYQFLQGRAVMMTTGSFDLRSLRSQATFRLAIGPLPVPEPGDPRYGRGVLGPLPEVGVGSGRFGLTRSSANPAQALDFLKFLSSVDNNSKFAASTEWIPAVVGAKVPEAVAAFAPQEAGYPGGFTLFSGLGPFADLHRIMLNLHGPLLFSRSGNLEPYLDALERDFSAALHQDFRRILRNRRTNIRRLDTFAGILELAPSSEPSSRPAVLRQAQLAQELSQTWLEYNLALQNSR
jgi:raffinose/stachyose/melibiose transport system substrate-binding protein